MRESAWIGIDFGTSGCRVCAIDLLGNIIAQIEQNFSAPPYPYPSPKQQSHYLFEALKGLVKQIPEFVIESISIDATSGSVMLSDHQGNPLTEMLMYNDQHASLASEKIAEKAPINSAVRGPSSGLAKLLYFQSTLALPEKYYLLHQADWLAIQLGATPGMTDYNNALKSGFDVIANHWPSWLKSIIKAGTTDSLAAFIATGANRVGEGVTSLGSTLVLKLICKNPVFDAETGLYSHKLGNRWLCGGASNTGGAVLRHFFTDEQLMTLSQKWLMIILPL